jgi:hypothetical protein
MAACLVLGLLLTTNTGCRRAETHAGTYYKINDSNQRLVIDSNGECFLATGEHGRWEIHGTGIFITLAGIEGEASGYVSEGKLSFESSTTPVGSLLGGLWTQQLPEELRRVAIDRTSSAASPRETPIAVYWQQAQSCLALFKEAETAVLSYVAQFHSAGTLPVTEGGNIDDDNGPVKITGSRGEVFAWGMPGQLFTLDQVLHGSMCLADRRIAWPAGDEPADQLLHPRNFPVYNQRRNGFVMPAHPEANVLDWTPYNRMECSAIGPPSAVNLSDGTVDFSNGANFYLDAMAPLRGNRVAYVVLVNVPLPTARELSKHINIGMDQAEKDYQVEGRFIFGAPEKQGTGVTCYYMLISI